MAGSPWRHRFWATVYDLSARHPWAGTIAGLGLVVLLVPVLSFVGGNRGTLGPSIPLFFLVPVLLASALGGRVAGVVVSVAAVAVWDWFFIPPLFQPTISYPRDLLGLIIYLLVGLLTGQLATVARDREEDAVRRAHTSEALYDLSTALIGSHDLAAVLPALTQRLRETFDFQGCAILLREQGGWMWHTAAMSGSIPDDLRIEQSRNIAGILSWVGTTGQMCSLNVDMSQAGVGSPTHPQSSPAPRTQFWPLRAGARLVGVLELIYKPDAVLDPQRERLLTTLVNGAAIALEQERLFQEEQDVTLARESDRLKSVLLSSVSHDLRTPLAGIKAAASSLLQQDIEWSEEDRRAFAADIDTEADRLARLVSNLLDLSRIEAGAIKPSTEWEDVGELVERVVGRLRPRLPAHPIRIDIAPGLPLVRFDAVHIEQGLTNLIENAAKYSSEGSPITVAASVAPSADGGGDLHLSVIDRGPGISAAEQTKIFDKFYRIAGSGRRTGGTGMGLAIVKGLVEANGGRVVMESELGQGSTFTMVLRLAEAQLPAGAGPDLSQPESLELPSP